MVHPNLRCIEVKGPQVLYFISASLYYFSVLKRLRNYHVCKTFAHLTNDKPLQQYMCYNKLFIVAVNHCMIFILHKKVRNLLPSLRELKCVLLFADCMSPTVQGMGLAAGNEVAIAKKQITLLLIRLFKMVSKFISISLKCYC